MSETRHRFYILKYPSINELVDKMEKFGDLLDSIIPEDTSSILLLTKPIGIMYRVLKYFIDSKIVSFSGEQGGRIKYLELVVSSPYLSITDLKTIGKEASQNVEHAIKFVSSEPYLLYSVIRDFMIENHSGKTLIIINDLTDLVMFLGDKKTYSLLRDLGLLIYRSGGVLLALLPKTIIDKRVEAVIVNLADEVIEI